MSHRVSICKDLSVSPICFGTWQLSPKFWGDVPGDDVIKAMREGFDLGVNFFDTADAYGDGFCETVVGKGLKELPRDQVVLATKVYNHFYDDGRRHGDLSKSYILQACEASLTRLDLDYIDLYQCHAFDPLAEPRETIDALEQLVRQGKIRRYGVSNWTVQQMRLARSLDADYQTWQPFYSLLRRTAESEILPYCQQHDLGVLVYSPLHNGLLTGKYTGGETFEDFRVGRAEFQGETFVNICDAVLKLAPIAEKYDMTIVQLVLTVTLMHPGITCAIVGIKKPAHIREAAQAMGRMISREDWYQVRQLLPQV